MLTRPTQTVPVTLSNSIAAQIGTMTLSDSTSHREDTIVEEVPLEGLQGSSSSPYRLISSTNCFVFTLSEGLYDLADPSVNLHEFIVGCLATPK